MGELHLVDVMRRCSQCVDASNVGYIMSKMLSKTFVDVNKMPSKNVFVMLTKCRLKLFLKHVVMLTKCRLILYL